MIFAVTPCAGVWIEIYEETIENMVNPSLPVWECGLKLFSRLVLTDQKESLPVWIEMETPERLFTFRASLPAWECGLLHEYYNKNSIEL